MLRICRIDVLVCLSFIVLTRPAYRCFAFVFLRKIVLGFAAHTVFLFSFEKVSVTVKNKYVV